MNAFTNLKEKEKPQYNLFLSEKNSKLNNGTKVYSFTFPSDLLEAIEEEIKDFQTNNSQYTLRNYVEDIVASTPIFFTNNEIERDKACLLKEISDELNEIAKGSHYFNHRGDYKKAINLACGKSFGLIRHIGDITELITDTNAEVLKSTRRRSLKNPDEDVRGIEKGFRLSASCIQKMDGFRFDDQGFQFMTRTEFLMHCLLNGKVLIEDSRIVAIKDILISKSLNNLGQMQRLIGSWIDGDRVDPHQAYSLIECLEVIDSFVIALSAKTVKP